MYAERKKYHRPVLVKQQNLRQITYSDPGFTCSLPGSHEHHQHHSRRRHGRR